MYEVFYKGTMIAQFKYKEEANTYYMHKLECGYNPIHFYISHTNDQLIVLIYINLSQKYHLFPIRSKWYFCHSSIVNEHMFGYTNICSLIPEK